MSLELGARIDEIIEQHDVTRQQIRAVVEFAARNRDAPPLPPSGASVSIDAHPV